MTRPPVALLVAPVTLQALPATTARSLPNEYVPPEPAVREGAACADGAVTANAARTTVTAARERFMRRVILYRGLPTTGQWEQHGADHDQRSDDDQRDLPRVVLRDAERHAVVDAMEHDAGEERIRAPVEKAQQHPEDRERDE